MMDGLPAVPDKPGAADRQPEKRGDGRCEKADFLHKKTGGDYNTAGLEAQLCRVVRGLNRQLTYCAGKRGAPLHQADRSKYEITAISAKSATIPTK